MFFDVLEYLAHFSEQADSILVVLGFLKLANHTLTLGKLLFKIILGH
jgi:hypothetical protein